MTKNGGDKLSLSADLFRDVALHESGYDAVDGSSTGATSAMNLGAVRAPMIRRSQIMQTVTTIGLDIAKSVFQVHCVDADGNVVLRRQLKRRYVLAFFQKLLPCLVGIEACASSHHWSRELQALGHTVRLMPPAYVKPYVKRHKNDAADAEAICEAVTRPNMRFVPTKTPEQQSCLTLHRTRHLFIRQQTATSIQSARILPSSESSRRLGAMVSSGCLRLSPMQMTPGFPK
jgi:Transposase